MRPQSQRKVGQRTRFLLKRSDRSPHRRGRRRWTAAWSVALSPALDARTSEPHCRDECPIVPPRYRFNFKPVLLPWDWHNHRVGLPTGKVGTWIQTPEEKAEACVYKEDNYTGTAVLAHVAAEHATGSTAMAMFPWLMRLADFDMCAISWSHCVHRRATDDWRDVTDRSRSLAPYHCLPMCNWPKKLTETGTRASQT